MDVFVWRFGDLVIGWVITRFAIERLSRRDVMLHNHSIGDHAVAESPHRRIH
jgi:hypothetical protein